jgi:CubicO group peptidase (beta-lactamase class C family)
LSDPRIERELERAVELGEIGVQVAAWHGDDLLVDAWIGTADEATGRAVDGDTLFSIFSVSKPFVATAIHLLAERGHLDVDEPMARYWPEYAVNGKDTITIRHVLQHRAGVPQMPPHLTPDGLADWDAIVEWLAQVTPMAPPGEKSLYHSISFGYLLGEIIRRTDPAHRMFDRFVAEEYCEPLGLENLWFSLPGEEERRVATLTWGPNPPSAPQVPLSPIRKAMVPTAIAPVPEVANLRVVHQAVKPSSGGIMNARDGARFFAMLANGGELGGVRFLSKERLMAQTAPRSNPLEVDEGMGMVVPSGVGGYWVGATHPHRDPVLGQGAHVLGHLGAGGSYGWADLDTGIGVMITHNRMFGAVPEDRHPFVGLARVVNEIAAG